MVNRWGNNGNRDRLYFLGLQNHHGQWLQPWNWYLVHGRKTMANLDSVLKKQRFPFGSKGLFFPVVMYRCENWTIKKAEHQRTDALKLWCWRVPWTGRRSNQSILKDINPEYSLEGLILKLQYFGYLMRRAKSWKRPWCWEGMRAGKEGSNRGWDGCKHHQLNGHELGNIQEIT